jgi:hypothetical protein
MQVRRTVPLAAAIGICLLLPSALAQSQVKITTISPTSLAPGMILAINGSGFGTKAGSVSFGTITVKAPISWTNSQVVVTVPNGVTAGSLHLVTSNGTSSNSETHTVLSLPVISLQMKVTGGTYPPMQLNGTFTGSRLWDASPSSTTGNAWSVLEPASGSYDFDNVDAALAALYAGGVKDGIDFTFGAVPNWASSAKTDRGCAFGEGTCDLPSDLAPDGTGTDSTFVTFVTALAQHVNNTAYLQGAAPYTQPHAHIKFWEVWNEWYANPTVNSNFSKCGNATPPTCQIKATYAQMVRLAEDVRCTITGAGAVNGTACTSSPIDTTALILTPSSEPSNVAATQVMENFLHCDSPINNSACPTGNRGSSAVDVIAWHTYPASTPAVPEDLLGVMKTNENEYILSTTDLARPTFSTEGSWGTHAPPSAEEPGFVARYLLDCFSAGYRFCNWYEYDNAGWGTLCNNAPMCSGLDPAGVAFGEVSSWLEGNTLSACTAGGSDGTTYTCMITTPSGSKTEAVWDTFDTPSFSSPAWATEYFNVDGTSNLITGGTMVSIGYEPILFSQN